MAVILPVLCNGDVYQAMGISVQWNNPDRSVMLFQFEPPWDWSEFHAAVLNSHLMLSEVDHCVTRIFDIHRYQHLPTGVLEEARHIQERLHPNFNPTVIVIGEKPLARSLGELFVRVYRRRPNFRILFASSLVEAMTKANQMMAQAPAI